ncbi:hypothetical protein [Cupriavidus pinatubonensis]|uniref:hypothetical protein n=1 Tax=Cupriavidus pinatubonensis TaxID=248026 RepID=UPI0011261BA0|nr:hypothetical protein [Cupriavidus pinatubonensis]TPQ39606.1 hypothetical protein C2U69_11725 [Cupriavidus pinatubonensis]
MRIPTLSQYYWPDNVAHKSHVNLLRAVVLLAGEFRLPKLRLTPSESEFDSRLDLAGVTDGQVGDVLALDGLSRNDLLVYLVRTSELIFLSVAKMFGLLLLKAGALGGVNVVSGHEFVRDVCSPIRNFDPNSPYSNACAVARFVQGDTAPLSDRSAPTSSWKSFCHESTCR